MLWDRVPVADDLGFFSPAVAFSYHGIFLRSVLVETKVRNENYRGITKKFSAVT